MLSAPVDLEARARQALVQAGFHPDFSHEICQEVKNRAAQPAQPPDGKLRDLRELLWSSIDNDTSRDLDQVEYAENLGDGAIRLLIGIADVDASVSKGS